MFDVTMGSYDGAETCELIGLYMLSLIGPKFRNQVGFYRDDGLAVCNATPREIEKIKQEVSSVFKANGLKITIEANKKSVNFLDVTFNLANDSYRPYMKPRENEGQRGRAGSLAGICEFHKSYFYIPSNGSLFPERSASIGHVI